MDFFFSPVIVLLGALSSMVRSMLGLVGLAMYILRSMGLYRMAMNTGMGNAWFAWVPLLHEYQCARLGDRARATQGRAPFLVRLLIITAAVCVGVQIFQPLFGGIFLIGALYRVLCWLASGAVLVVCAMADFWLYTDYEPSLAAAFTVLSVIRLDGIPKFLIRDNVPVGVSGAAGPRQPKYQQG